MGSPPPQPASAVIRTAVVIVAVGVVMAMLRYFHDILTPLVVATFLLLLMDALAHWVERRVPSAPAWARRGLAGVIILAVFALVGGAMALQAPAFAARLQALGPRLEALVIHYGALAGMQAASIEQLISGINIWSIVGSVFATARSVVSYGVLVVIYLGFLIVSRATFGAKVESLFDNQGQRDAARRVAASLRHAVEQYVKLQTFKAGLTALVAFISLSVAGVNDAIFIAFAVFLAVYVPIIGPAFGVVLPVLITLAQFGELARPAMVFAAMEFTVFVNGNVIMPKLQSDSLNVDPLLVLMSLGFWGLMLGAPGVVLSTPLTVTVMAVAAEFRNTRWLAVLLSKDGRPFPDPHGA